MLRNDENEKPQKQGSAKKRPNNANHSGVKKKIYFPDDLAPVDKDYESPHVDLSQTTCSTPSNTITTSLKDGPNYTMNDVLDFVNSKLNEVMDAQEVHMRKVAKENSVFRKRLLEVLGNGEKPESINKIKKSIKALRVEHKPRMFHGKDLMSIKPNDDGPSVFGRMLAPHVFGEEKECILIKERMGCKVDRKNCRVACDEKLEEIFQTCVARNYVNDVDEAVSRAIAGANQYGVDMKAKFNL